MSFLMDETFYVRVCEERKERKETFASLHDDGTFSELILFPTK